MSEEKSFQEEITEIPDETKFDLQIDLASDLEPTDWSAERERIDPRGKKVKAAELVGKQFDIIKLRKFESSYPGQPYAYWVVVKTTKDEKLFNTVLGGSALINDIDVYLAFGLPNPMRVTLVEEEGGRYGRYYVFA